MHHNYVNCTSLSYTGCERNPFRNSYFIDVLLYCVIALNFRTLDKGLKEALAGNGDSKRFRRKEVRKVKNYISIIGKSSFERYNQCISIQVNEMRGRTEENKGSVKMSCAFGEKVSFKFL